MSSVEYNKLLKARSPILNPPIAPLNPSTQPPPSSIYHEDVLYPNDRNLAVDAMMRRQGPQQQPPFDPNYHANLSGNSRILASVDEPQTHQQLATKPLSTYNPPTVNARPTVAEAKSTTMGGSKKRKYKRARKVRKSRTRSRSRSRGRMSRRYK